MLCYQTLNFKSQIVIYGCGRNRKKLDFTTHITILYKLNVSGTITKLKRVAWEDNRLCKKTHPITIKWGSISSNQKSAVKMNQSVRNTFKLLLMPLQSSFTELCRFSTSLLQFFCKSMNCRTKRLDQRPKETLRLACLVQAHNQGGAVHGGIHTPHTGLKVLHFDTSMSKLRSTVS